MFRIVSEKNTDLCIDHFRATGKLFLGRKQFGKESQYFSFIPSKTKGTFIIQNVENHKYISEVETGGLKLLDKEDEWNILSNSAIQCHKNNKCIDIVDGFIDRFSNLQLYPKNETYAQKFKIELVPMDAEAQAKESICISYSLDNNHFDLLRMSVISVLENSNLSTEIVFYIQHTSDFKKEYKDFFKNLCKTYPNVKFNFIDMKDAFHEFKNADHVSTAGFYRMALPTLLKDVDKIIYLDTDCLVFDDLLQVFKINMFGKPVMGYNKGLVICDGVMLMDLKKLREMNFEKLCREFMKSHDMSKLYGDEAVINTLLEKDLSFFPYNIGTFDFLCTDRWLKLDWINRLRPIYPLNDLIKNDEREPIIMHLVSKGAYDTYAGYYRIKYIKELYMNMLH